MNKTLIWILVFLAIVTTVSAAQVYKQGDYVDIKIPCTNNGTYCSSTATCTATIISPNGTALYNNDTLTNQVGYFNITLNPNQTDQLGDYDFTPCCIDGTLTECKSLNFKITASGKETTDGEATIYAILIFMFVALGGFSAVGAWRINGQNEYDFGGGGELLKINFNKYWKMLLWFLAYLFLVFTVFYCWQLSELLTMTEMTPIFKSLFLTLEILFAPFFLVWGYLMIIKWTADIKLWKLSQRGLGPR